ncbi:hydroxyacylglutathione hydrolase [Herminiimonas sp. CN]|uniref:hydroxyacylglutathione hydrolase n=1 Tax=Herminiimonas sp. CN TaxID=1349818 RepID=UPI00047341D2|nr:hydroxyacylglutathione hydrolase [Herminiimonas sp. CN]
MSTELPEPLLVLAVPAFNDNYLWLIHDGRSAAVVDPGDATPILAVLARLRLKLVAILLTHHHGDHVGGVAELLQHFTVPVYGPKSEIIAGISKPLSQGDDVIVPELGLNFSVLEVPGHTLDHIAYVAPRQGWLFCGDTLFAGGCGRLFEGTPAQMRASLAKLAALPDTTQVYCAHEYTLANLRFALEVEPDNADLAARFEREQAKRAQGLATVPSTIGLEKATNPFLRDQIPAVTERLIACGRLQESTPAAAFAALRAWKNIF